MRYVMLIANSVDRIASWEGMSREEDEADRDVHRAWFQEHGEHIRGGEELELPRTARTVRRGEGGVVVTDGPFAETKEQVGGFVILDVPDEATALRIASAWPGIERWDAVVEVRRVYGEERA